MGTKIKQGDYIHWVADRMFKAWNTYGKVLSIEDGQAKIITYDDFKETSISIDGEATDKEIRVVDKDEANLYFKKRKIAIDNQIAELELKFETEKTALDKLKSRYETTYI